jgi:hypothetical protein
LLVSPQAPYLLPPTSRFVLLYRWISIRTTWSNYTKKVLLFRLRSCTEFQATYCYSYSVLNQRSAMVFVHSGPGVSESPRAIQLQVVVKDFLFGLVQMVIVTLRVLQPANFFIL